MHISDKLEILVKDAQFDLCGSYFCSPEAVRRKSSIKGWIYPTVFPNGITVRLLKILLSNDCVHNCYYCANRADRFFKRLSLTEDEMVRVFLELKRKNLVDGLFLSSAVTKSAVETMNSMIKIAEILREKYNFKGYIHLKILPESKEDYIIRAIELADRVSINIEAPNSFYLRKIAPEKNFDNLFKKFELIKNLYSKGLKPKHGVTTQLVVGASGEKDKEILSTIFLLYEKFNLTRAYFSAFKPIPETPFEDLPATSTWREHRLYQADFLIRKYYFTLKDLPFDHNGNLYLEKDPKWIWAINHEEFFPIEINKAGLKDLLRVPGIGPISAKKIIEKRKEQPFKNIKELEMLGINVKRALPFILINGKRPREEGQLKFF
ncbi:MAG: radical SAM protein [Dictyoglomus sp.]|nr:radical SAM protein [Dictyoglomus sp.]MCX7942227.1 radical SAM protein [Dictyoglomaceae bacterium]MDW8188690.1 radical SAM protein [Dictyoglomus sp.]